MSMVFIKEKSLVKGYLDGKYTGCFDFATGKYYGIRGSEVKHNPKGFNSSAIVYDYKDENSEVDLLLKAMNTLFGYERKHSSCREEARAFIEQMLSLGLYAESYTDIQLLIESKKKLKINKDFVNRYTNKYGRKFTYYNYLEYLADRESEEIFGQDRDKFFSTFICEKCGFLDNKDKKKLYNLMVKERISDFKQTYEINRNINNKSLLLVIKDAILLRQETKTHPVIPDRNLLLECSLTMYNYKMNKDETNNILIKKNNDNEKLYYENDEVIIRPLLSVNAFHDEAEKQCNCVERIYMEKIIHGETYIVNVRMKNEPNKSYITCEVSKYGAIRQFLYSYNRMVKDDYGSKLYDEYQKHLLNVWEH